MEVCAVNTAVEANEVQDRKKRSRSKKVLGKGVLFPPFVGSKNKERTKKNQKLDIDRIGALMEVPKRTERGWK